MNKKNEYKTMQKNTLLEYMKETGGKHQSARDIYDGLRDRGIQIGLTTVYRHLDKLASEGTIAKYIIDENTPACFEYTGHHDHEEPEDCYHCKCVSCGKLIHMHCDEVQKLEKHILEEHGFLLDMHRTVFYGLCDACRMVNTQE